MGTLQILDISFLFENNILIKIYSALGGQKPAIGLPSHSPTHPPPTPAIGPPSAAGGQAPWTGMWWRNGGEGERWCAAETDNWRQAGGEEQTDTVA